VLTTKCEKLAERLKILRNLGLETRDNCVEWASNSRLDSMQAAMLTVKMKYLRKWTDNRRQNAQIYREKLGSIDEIILPPEEKTYERSVYHTFVIKAKNRDNLMSYLRENGIGTAVHYPVPIHLTAVGSKLGYPLGSFPTCEAQAKSILSLPVYPEMTKENLNLVCTRIKEFYTKY